MSRSRNTNLSFTVFSAVECLDCTISPCKVQAIPI